MVLSIPNHIEWELNQILVQEGKGDKDRRTILPKAARASLSEHLTKVKALHEQDLAEGFGEVYLPHTFDRKSPQAAQSRVWQ